MDRTLLSLATMALFLMSYLSPHGVLTTIAILALVTIATRGSWAVLQALTLQKVRITD